LNGKKVAKKRLFIGLKECNKEDGDRRLLGLGEERMNRVKATTTASTMNYEPMM
jgi:hypothetical protein